LRDDDDEFGRYQRMTVAGARDLRARLVLHRSEAGAGTAAQRASVAGDRSGRPAASGQVPVPYVLFEQLSDIGLKLARGTILRNAVTSVSTTKRTDGYFHTAQVSPSLEKLLSPFLAVTNYSLLDPTADKALLAGVYVSLWLVGQLPGWLVGLVVLRDFLIILGFVLIQTTTAPKRFDPLSISKLNTLVQLSLIGFVLAQGLGIESETVKWLLIAAAAVTTVLSGLSYLVRWARILAGSERAL
jgi:hypothetical protein